MSYVSEAAELFQCLNPEMTVLSPDDYLTIAEWEKQEIPLSLVLGAIRDLSAGNGRRNRTNLVEIKQDVKDKYSAWLCGQIPQPPAGRYIQN